MSKNPNLNSTVAPLHRRGAWLHAPHSSWQMASVHGPVPVVRAEPDRQYFRVETTSHDVLLVSRPLGERGMRELRLEFLLPAS